MSIYIWIYQKSLHSTGIVSQLEVESCQSNSISKFQDEFLWHQKSFYKLSWSAFEKLDLFRGRILFTLSLFRGHRLSLIEITHVQLSLLTTWKGQEQKHLMLPYSHSFLYPLRNKIHEKWMHVRLETDRMVCFSIYFHCIGNLIIVNMNNKQFMSWCCENALFPVIYWKIENWFL